MIDELASRLDIDPLEMRRINETSDRRRGQMEIGAGLIGWERRRPDGSAPGRIKTGLGMGAAHWYAWGDRCLIDVDIYPNGRVEVLSGSQDIGTGTRTVLVDVAADQLGIDRSWITGKIGRSDFPPGPASGGSVVSRLVATTTRDAAEKAKQELIAEVASEWGVEADRIVLEGGVFRGRDGDRSLDWPLACALIHADKISARGRFRRELAGGGDAADMTSGTHFAEVEVDTETGSVRVMRIVAVQACGQVVNRLTAENQICGGVVQGLSYALFEERILDRTTGAMLNPNLEGYKIAGSVDIPEIIPVLDADDGDPGVRSIGEPVTIPTAGAIANAVANAIGARVRSLPITPERVLEALGGGGRV
jgi:xanthine dehydrogenase YagR molybdenum-binding subunit